MVKEFPVRDKLHLPYGSRMGSAFDFYVFICKIDDFNPSKSSSMINISKNPFDIFVTFFSAFSVSEATQTQLPNFSGKSLLTPKVFCFKMLQYVTKQH